MSNEDKFQNLQFIKLDFTLDDYTTNMKDIW